MSALPDRKPAAALPVTNAEKARALIAMLEPGEKQAAAHSPEQLRAWARDLIRTVEGSGRGAGTVSPPSPKPKRHALFSKAAPTLTAPPAAAPTRPEPVRPRAAARMTLAAPVQHEPVAAAAPDVRLPPADVRRIVEATVEPATLAREHPAVIAMTLIGKPTIEQAAALRRLPGGQVRAVHRALRQFEGAEPG
ncbi:hypothetical protein [Jannaschia marina]|uniref:hypothetical protein n=1 Tax=Jannaschia marina TaxID=2741674 RepID=UPI0015C80AB5|nr:hypothetical protein [Jannaschia marina]